MKIPFRFVLSATLYIVAATGCAEENPHAPLRVERAEYSSEALGQTIVAEVNGEPVYDGCVATQAEAKQIDRRAALQECIDFELLAQAAREAGLLEHRNVLEVRKREAVRAMVDREFGQTFSSPEGLPIEDVRRLYETSKRGFVHAAERTTSYCRAEVEKKTERGSELDVLAEEKITSFYNDLRGVRGLTRDEFNRLCALINATSAEPFTTRRNGPAVREYAEASFSISEIGMVSKPIRHKWGWDVLLLERIIPARNTPFEEAEAELRDMMFNTAPFEKYRRSVFERWMAGYNTANVLINQAVVDELVADPLEIEDSPP